MYGTLGGPYAPTENYAATRKGNRIFLHILNPEMPELVLKAIAGRKIIKASVLNSRPVRFSIKEGNVHIPLPAALKGAEDYIIVLELDGDAEELAVIS